MKEISYFSKIYLARNPVDFRKQAHGLAVIIKEGFGYPDLNSKNLFVFTNKKRNSIKLIYWDNTGYALWWKSLEKNRFRWPKSASECQSIQPRELKWLLEGIDIDKIKVHQRLALS